MSQRALLRLLTDGPAPGFARAGTPADYAPDLRLEPTRLSLHLRPDIARRGVEGTAVHTVTGRTTGARSLKLDAVDLDIRSVTAPDGHALTWRHDGNHIHITWAEPVPRGDTRKVEVCWSVAEPVSGLVGAQADRGPDSAPFLATDHETHRARYWLPCVDHPSVRPHLRIALTVPQGHTAVANGALESDEAHEDGTHTVTWVLDEPCPSYLTCFVTGELAEASGGTHTTADGRVVPIQFYAPAPLTEADLTRTFAPTADMLAWITRKLDSTFPYPKYYQFAVPGIGGAMENISLVSWDEAFVADPLLHEELGWLIDHINLHEMAHTWFGDALVCRDHAHSWLKESWAVYMESLYVEDTKGLDALHLQVADDREAYLSEADGRYIRPIATRHFESAWDLFDRHLYPGGAIRLHLLRHELGDADFWRGVHTYLGRFRHRVVETDDFRRCMEEASGRSLAQFFDHWFRSPGYPRLEADWDFDAESGEGTVTVTRKAWGKDQGVPDFEVPICVAVQAQDGTWQRVDARLEHSKVKLRVPLSADARQVVIDPDSVLPARITLDFGLDQLIASVTDCPHVRGRLDAATALGKKARRKGLDALATAYRTEVHWQVRAAFARALGAAASAHAPPLLAGLLTVENDARPMSALLTACGQHRSPELAAAVSAWLDHGPRPYRATAAAYVALGKQRDARHEARLLTAAHDSTGWFGWTQRGAVQGLGELRTAGAVSALESLATTPTTRQPVRVAAAESLGQAARWQPTHERERVLEVLTALTLDTDTRVRAAAARGLAALGLAKAASAVDALARIGVPSQDRPRTERLAEAIRKGNDAGRVAALEQQLEALKQQLNRLAKRLDGKG